MDRFDGINGTKTCKVHAQTLVSSVSHKIAAKISYSLSNITSSLLLTKMQLSLIHFIADRLQMIVVVTY